MDRRHYILILALNMVLFTCNVPNYIAAARPKEPLQLSIIFDKTKYKPEDSIKLKFSVKNIGRKPIYVNKRFFINSEDSDPKHREVYLKVISPSGKRLSFNPLISTGLPRTDDLMLLKPGDKADSDREKQIKYYFNFEEKGKYEITAVYRNIYGEEIGLDAYKGEVMSEPVNITIDG